MASKVQALALTVKALLLRFWPLHHCVEPAVLVSSAEQDDALVA